MEERTSVRVKARTEAAITISVNIAQPIGDAKRGASVIVAVGATNLLTWLVVGDPGTVYEITLTCGSEGYEIKTTPEGSNPVKSAISTRLFRGSGHMDFRVVPKKEK